MGYNTTVVVLDDALSEIEGDKDFGKTLSSKISEKSVSNNPIDVPAKSGTCTHANAAQVIESHHADIVTLVAVGGNTGKVLARGHGVWRMEESDLLELLNTAAQNLGYELTKKKDD